MSGCARAFDDRTQKPADFCYPFPADLIIVAYKPATGGRKASLLVRVTNHGRGPVELPIGITPKRAGGKQSYIDFTVNSQNAAATIGYGGAYGDTEDFSSIAAIDHGESVDYEIPLDVEALKRMLQLNPGTEVPVVAKLSSHIIEMGRDGQLTMVSDKSPIASGVFHIPYSGLK